MVSQLLRGSPSNLKRVQLPSAEEASIHHRLERLHMILQVGCRQRETVRVKEQQYLQSMLVHSDPHNCVCVSISVHPDSDLLVKYNYRQQLLHVKQKASWSPRRDVQL